MVYCAAFGCNNVHKKGCGKSFFTFPKDSGRRKKWTFFCKREGFVPTKNHRLCSDHFTKDQIHRDPTHLEQFGYDGARIRLKDDAVPDIPLRISSENAAIPIVLPARKRGAYMKRQKADIIHQALQELEPRHSSSENIIVPVEPQPQPEKASEPIDSFEPDATAAEQPIRNEASSMPMETLSKRCQANVTVPQRTRRIQVSMDKRPTVSTGTQCSSLSDGIPLHVAAGLAPVPQPQCASETASDPHSDAESDFEDDGEDPNYDPLDGEDPGSDGSDDECEEGFRLQTDVPPEEERQFLVSEGQLAKLLQNCVTCGSVCDTVVKGTRGTMISTSSACPNGHSHTWESQRCHQKMPWANLLVAGAIIFSGANASKSLRLFRHLNLQMISTSTFSRLQASYVVPASVFTWDFHQQTLLAEYQGRNLTLGGDARCDSPGFTAKFGSYTLMELSSGKILDFQLVQSNEVAGSTHMELEGLKRGLQRLEDAGLHVENLVTDRHGMIKKYMREEHEDKNHFFDVWHVAKGISKKLESASKKRDCGTIRPWIKSSVNHCYWVAASGGDDCDLKEQKWSSLVEHVANQHDHCEHGPLNEDRLWLRAGSRAHKLFREVVESRFLLRDVSKLSPLHQTYGLEVYHSVVNTFAPKNTHFFYSAMMARLCVSALHFNENGQRHQATTKDGEARWQICYPKGKKGTEAVVKPRKTAVTYDYVDVLRLNLCERRRQHPTYTMSTDDAHIFLGYKPQPLTSGFEGCVKEDLIATRRSRFRR